MAILCLETDNEKAGEYIGLINECDPEYQAVLSDFLQTKVFKLLDEKGEPHQNQISERKQSNSEMDLDRRASSNEPKIHANRGEVA